MKNGPQMTRIPAQIENRSRQILLIGFHLRGNARHLRAILQLSEMRR
jgi:hypothetical protein